MAVNPEVIGSIPAKTQKTQNPNLHGFELHEPSSKSTKLLSQVIKAIIIQIRPQNWFPIASRPASVPSRSALADSSDLHVLLITRLSKADKNNRRGRSPSICRTQWSAGIKIRHWHILEDSMKILKVIFEKNRVRKIWSIISRLYKNTQVHQFQQIWFTLEYAESWVVTVPSVQPRGRRIDIKY